MSFNTDFKNHVFISYSQLDNISVESDDGWVDLFHKGLHSFLGQYLGETPRIYRDRGLIGNNFHLTSSIKESAIFICILSPNYLQSRWCLGELQTFYLNAETDNATGKSRIFKVLKTPIKEQINLLPQLQQTLDYDFFEYDGISHRINSFNSSLGDTYKQKFFLKLADIAHDIAETIQQLTLTRNTPQYQQSQPPSKSIGLTPNQDAYQVSNQSTASHPLSAFLCHSSGDKKAVRALYHRLVADGIKPWLDEEDLLPGQRWQMEIPRAVRNSDVAIVCLSKSSIAKTGFVQNEMKFVLDAADAQPEGTIYLIPLRLEECDVPERLQPYQWVNMYEENGYNKLMRSLMARATRLSISS